MGIEPFGLRRYKTPARLDYLEEDGRAAVFIALTGGGPEAVIDDHTAEGDELAGTARERWAALVDSGEVEMFGEPTGEAPVLSEPDPAWGPRFREVHDRIRRALGTTALRVEHIGSTAVAGLIAKPIIDVQVSVPDIEAEATYREQLAGLGWPMRSREPGHRYFRTGKGVKPRIHVHVGEAGSTWEREHLLFRDYLRSHPDRAEVYAAIKRRFVGRYGDDMLAYTAAKAPFIRSTVETAELWAAETNWSVGPGRHGSAGPRQQDGTA